MYNLVGMGCKSVCGGENEAELRNSFRRCFGFYHKSLCPYAGVGVRLRLRERFSGSCPGEKIWMEVCYAYYIRTPYFCLSKQSIHFCSSSGNVLLYLRILSPWTVCSRWNERISCLCSRIKFGLECRPVFLDSSLPI